MKRLLLVTVTVALGVVLALPPEDHISFKQLLEEIRDSDKFKHMSVEEQLMLSELTMAAQESQTALNHYIDRVTFSKVIQFMDHLDGDTAQEFEAHLYALAVNGQSKKRQQLDFKTLLQELHEIKEVTHHMPETDKKHFDAIVAATKDNTLTQFIDKEGYGPLFALMSHVEDKHNKDFIDLLTRHLEMEAAMAANAAHTTTSA